MWERYLTPFTLTDALDLLARYSSVARIIAGGTDLLLEIERGIRRPSMLIDIHRIPGLDEIRLEDGWIHIGPQVTHNQAVASRLLGEGAFPLARACWEVGSPQIRNRGTIAGNLLTASPANDTVAPLRALDAQVTLQSAGGSRTLPLADLIQGVRRTTLAPDEMLTDIAFRALATDERGTFIKLGLRKSQAISVINVAAIVGMAGDKVTSARLALGSVAPTIVRASAAEAYLAGRPLDEDTILAAAELAAGAAKPIGDIRAPGEYRSEMVRVLVARALRQLRDGVERDGWPEDPALLQSTPATQSAPESNQRLEHGQGIGAPISLTVNGRGYEVRGAAQKSLLHLLRDDLGLIGTKEGCGEGECGACTVHLDGQAVMACLVPAAAAHGSQVVTIEGLADEDKLHPLQQAFIDEDAVQCGYCTPGMIMSGAKLLEEHPHPSHDQILQAMGGNLCRCTGYVNIVRAIERAAQAEE